MGLRFVFLPLLFGGIVTAIDDCKVCECCKNDTDKCIDNELKVKCLDGCIDGYYGPVCTHACIDNCLNCSDNTTCTKCREGFYGQSCNKCPDKCLTCSSSDNCQKCRDGFHNGRFHDKYGLYQYNCQFSCQPNCVSCTSYNNCTKYACKEGFVKPSCTQCINGRYGTNCDRNCSEKCVKCMSEMICAQCSPGHWGDTCMTCPQHCSNCNSSINCLSCDHGYYGKVCDSKCPSKCLNENCYKENGTCISCIDGFYGKDCGRKCPRNCAKTKCSSDGKCLSCVEGYFGDNCDNLCTCSERQCYHENGTCTIDSHCVCLAYCECDSKGMCKPIRTDVSLKNISEKCKVCSENCKGVICYSGNKNCTNSCNDGHLGSKCENNCETRCRQCVQDNGEYTMPGSKTCSLDCNITKNVRVCDRTCLNGCFSFANICKNCENMCNIKCLNNTCELKTENCLIRCHEGYTRTMCDNTKTHTVTDKISTVVIFGASVGSLLFIIIIMAVIILLIRRKIRVKKTRNEEVGINEMVPMISEVALRDPVYATPKKTKRNVRESVLPEEREKAKASDGQNSETEANEYVMIYEN